MPRQKYCVGERRQVRHPARQNGMARFGVLSLLWCCMPQASGQSVPPLGGIIPQGGSPVPLLAPTPPPAVGPGLSNAPPAVPAGAQGSVAVTAVTFEGATAFPMSRLGALAGGLTGPAVPLSALEEARAAIVSLYRGEGYAFVTADALLGADGTLRFRIAEGFISEVRLDGDIGPAGTQVLRFLNRLLNIQPLDVAALERQLLLAQDIPGITIRTVLRPAGTAPGALSLVAQVSRQAISGYLTADNRGPRFAGREQGLAAVQFNAFTEFGERTELALFYARGSTQVFGQASVQAFIGGSGLQVRLYAGRGAARPSGVLRGIGFEGETTTAGIALSYPVIRQRSQTLNVIGGFDLLESEVRVEDGAGQTQLLARDSLRVLRLGAEWTVFDLLLGESRPATNFLLARGSQGIAGLGATASDAPDASRLGARSGFTKFNAELTRTQALFAPWQGALVSLQGTIAGQWSNDLLPLSEKFYLGGNRLGRGFFAGEVTGDRAIALSAELQLATQHEVTAFGASLRLRPLYYTFYDHGRTFENRDTDPDRRLSSIGMGVRVQVNERFEAQIEGVRRLTRQPTSRNVPALPEDALFWRVLARF